MSPRRRPLLAGAVAAAISLLATGLSAGSALAAEPAAPFAAPTTAGSYVVRAEGAELDAVLARVTALGGTVGRRLSIIDGAEVRLTSGAAAALRADRRVFELSENAPLHLLAGTYDPATDAGSMQTVSSVTSAGWAWSRGATGKGVDVALLDSGVTRVPGLDGAGKVVYGPDLSFESQSDSTRDLDTYGHGTHMAGIIAGRDAGANPASPSSSSFLGMAPDARVVSIKVADAFGATDVSQVIAGIDWVVQHKNDPGRNIRVLNLSLGTASAQPYTLDPLAHAAEQAWLRGIVVVVAAGNDGTGTGRLLDPANDPYVVAVGAENSNGTMTVADDTIPAFSSRGDGVRNPDLVAPGVSIQSLRVPGSYIDTHYGSTGLLGDRFFRGSGTSQAAAVTSGAVALLLSQKQDLRPDQVKALLLAHTFVLPAADPQAQGRGLLRVDQVLKSAVPAGATQTFPRSTGAGSLEGARAGNHLVLDGVALTGETDVFGQTFDSAAHASLAGSASAWTGGVWNGTAWTGAAATASGWGSVAWTGRTWAGRTWAGRTWAGGIWDGRTWAGASWNDPASLTAGALTGRTWAGRTWADGYWG